LQEKVIVEHPTMRAFFSELQHGLNSASTQFVPEAILALRTTQGQINETTIDIAAASRDFFSAAPGNFIWLRTCLAEVNRAPDEAGRRRLLVEFSEEVRPPKIVSRVPALRSFWLLTFAAEGFAKQLSQRVSEVTPSALRTLEGTVDMLEMLCVGGLRSDLASDPPIRLLSVDDNAVCLRSMSLALKKVFSELDLAPEGRTALALTGKHAYDVIFLDVDMPGMNGFEVCAKIRESHLNRNTPVVFVTRHSDFESRAKSSFVGAQDLIGKPYLPAEITVKALMMALRSRIEREKEKAKSALRKHAEREKATKSTLDSLTTPASLPATQSA